MILFLDIDGVLNNYDQLIKEIALDSNKKSIDCGLDAKCVDNLNCVLACFPQVDIVITSDWKSVISLFKINKKLINEGLLRTAVDSTKEVMSGNRAIEISNFLKENDMHMDDEFVIVDDCYEEEILNTFSDKHFLHIVDGFNQNGFTCNHTQKLIDKIRSVLK